MKNKAYLKAIRSVKKPKAGGINAPPTIAVHNNPDALGFKWPIPSIANVNMVGNMMELNKPTAKMLHMLTKPVVPIDIRIKALEIVAKIASTFPGFITLVR